MAREGLSICFYMRRSHKDIARAVTQSLQVYLRALGSQALAWYVDQEGDWQELDSVGWDHIWRELRERSGLILELTDTPSGAGQYKFEYLGKSLDAPLFANNPDAVCAVEFWLPTKYLEEHGPAQVRQLALELAAPLPFSSGHGGLAIHALLQLVGVSAEIRTWSSRYPGFNVQNLEDIAWNIGTHVRGVHWLTFLGQPVLGELGGLSGLRTHLSSPDISVQEMEDTRALVTLGPWPEAGDTQQGQNLPLYREWARVLEPWLYQALPDRDLIASEERRHWERRFLD